MRICAVAAIVLLLAGCAGQRPPIPQGASVAIPPHWRGDPSPAAVVPVEDKWWQGFDDPVLNALVDRALARNVDLLAAAARIAEARAQLRLATSRMRPSVSLSASGGRDRSLNAFGMGYDETDGTSEAAISYEVDLFGRLSALKGAARDSYLASRAARDTLRLAVIATVVEAYIGLRAQDARLRIAQDTLATRQEELRLIRRQASIGYSAALDLRQAEVEYEATAQLVPATQLVIIRQENAISLLVGDAPGAVMRGKAFEDLGNVPIPSTLPAQLLRQRPDIAEAEDMLAAADRNLDAARAAFMPRIGLSASGGLVGSTVFASPVGLFSLGGSVLAPLFEGGALRAGADTAASRRDQAAFAYRKTVLTAFQQVEDAMAGIDRLSEQEKAAQHQSDAAAAAFRLASNRYRAGYAPYLEQLDAERSLLGARLAVIDIHADRLATLVQLCQSLGGGWSARGDEPIASPSLVSRSGTKGP